ncbi:MAG: transporter substrate-binding protein [Roseomonas sp.]|nr:transporter substrate-binding protein [Roseomonas sp.]
MRKLSAPAIDRRSIGLSLGTLMLAKAAPAAAAEASSALAPIGIARGRAAIGIMGGPLVGTFTRIADDIARFLALNAPQVPRAIPMVGTGGRQVAQDLLTIDGLDGAVVSAVVMDDIRRGGWLPDVTRRIAYVAELYSEETHILASTQISNVQALNGKVVNVGTAGGGTDIIARRLFEGLGVRPIFDNRPTAEALRGVPTGDPAAVVFVAGKPVAAFQDVSIVGNLHLVPITLDARTRPRVEPLYRQSVFENQDYPRFVPRNTTVPTVASSVFLVTQVYPDGSERKEWLSQVVTQFVQSLISLRAGAAAGTYHPKWQEANVLTRLPGYGRSPEVSAWFNSTIAAEPAPGDIPAPDLTVPGLALQRP